MTALEIFNPLITLFEYIYNVFAVFGEIANTKWIDIYNSLQPNADRITYFINNPFNENIFQFTLDFTWVGNALVSILQGLVALLNTTLPGSVNINELPLYVVVLILTIPSIILFWLIGIIKKIISS